MDAGEPSHRGFEASEATRGRWRSQQLPLTVASLCFGVLVIIELVEFGGLLLPIAVLATLLVMVIGFFAYVGYWSSPSYLPAGDLWVGNGTLQIAQLGRNGLSHQLTFGTKTRLKFWASAGVLSGRLEVRDDGLHWTMRHLARLAGVRGSVTIPWSEIVRLELGAPPGIVGSSHGGRYAIELASGGILDGQFRGTRRTLEVQLDAHLP